MNARSSLAAAAVLWLAALAGSPAAAQETDPPQAAAGAFGEKIEVTLVNVDVWVRDRAGIPVTGLGPGDFRVLHDGQPVPITHFVEIRGGVVASEPAAAGASADPEPAATPAPPSHLVVYFDFSRLHPSNVGPLVRGLEELLQSEAVVPERVLILRQDRSLSIEASFGSTGKELRKALQRLAAGGAAGMDTENDTRLALEAIRTAWDLAQDTVGSAAGGIAMVPDAANPTGEPGVGGGGSPRAVVGGIGSGGGPDACGMFVNQVRPTLESWAHVQGRKIAMTLGNLSDAAGFLAGLPGVKMLLYLSDGLDTQPGAALATYASGLCPAAGAELLSDAFSEQMSDRFLELTRHANTNRVTIHALQATGLRSPEAASAVTERGPRGGGSQRSSGAFEARRRVAEREGLSLIARETGGRAVFNRNEFGAELIEIGGEASTYYSLAYELPPESGTGGRRGHRIAVEVGDGSLTTRYRRGYHEKDPRRWLTERVEGALNLGITSNPLEVRLGAGAVQAAGDGTVRFPLHVMIPVERLAFEPRDGQRLAEVTLEVLARSLATSALAKHDQSFRVKAPSEATGFADLPVMLEIGEGAHLIALGVQDRGSGEASFVSTTIDAGPGS